MDAVAMATATQQWALLIASDNK